MTQIKTIYFSGGGTRGMSFSGVLKTLEEYNLLDEIDTIIGVSIGSMVATALSLGVSWKDLYNSFFDFNVATCAHIEIEHLLTKFGLDCGKKFMTQFIKIFKKYSGKKNLTFKEHYELTGKKLIISSACVNDQTTHYFDYQTAPNLKIINAVRMSISLPFYFTSQKYQRKHMIDGSTFEHFPIKLFGDPETFLGINIIQSSITTFTPIKGIDSFISNIVGGTRKQIAKMERLIVNQQNYKIIDLICDEPLLDFQNKKSLKIRLFQNGYDTSKKYIIENILNKPHKKETVSNKDIMEKRMDILEQKIDTILKLLQHQQIEEYKNIKSTEDNIIEPSNNESIIPTENIIQSNNVTTPLIMITGEENILES